MIYCTCGHLLVESEYSQNFNKWRLDALSIPHYVIKKGRCHGARHGKIEELKEYHIAFNAWKRCCKKVDSQLKIGANVQRDGRVGKARSHVPSLQRGIQKIPKKGQWYLTLNNSGKNAPMRLRSDFRVAVSLKNRLHRESNCRNNISTAIQEMALSSSDSWWDWDTSKSWWSS